MLLRDYISSCARRLPAKAAYIHAETQRSWRDMHIRSDKLLAALQAAGLAKGSRVGIISHNRIEICEHWFACLKGGLVRVGLNWRYSDREIAHVAQDSKLAALIVDAACAAEHEQSLMKLQQQGMLVVAIGQQAGVTSFTDYEALIAAQAGHEPSLPPIDPQDVAMVAYTSGTTGLPKGVLLSHGAVLESAIHTVLELGFRPDDVRAYVSNPAGLNIFQVAFNLFNGMTTVLDDFETERFLRLVERHRITCVTLIPTMLSRVVEAAQTGGYDLSSLRQIYYGSMPTTPAQIRTAYETLRCTFVQGYGVSESCGPIASLTDEDHRRAMAGEPELLRSIGRPFMHAEISIRGEDGREVATGQQGAVWIRSATRMLGYLNLPELTAESFEGEWLKTGDQGCMDAHGYVFVADRKKHMIISGGMNIYPTSVENVLHEHPAVHEAVVVGVPHPAWGQAVVAAVELKPGWRASGEELIAHCGGRLPRWEIPKYAEIFPELPKGNTDKLDKRAVEQHFIAEGRLPWAAAR